MGTNSLFLCFSELRFKKNFTETSNSIINSTKTRIKMKTAIFAAAGAGIASASMASLSANIMSLARSQNATGRASSRAFQGFVADAFEPMNGYGCWCYLDDTWRDANQVLINRPAILANERIRLLVLLGRHLEGRQPSSYQPTSYSSPWSGSRRFGRSLPRLDQLLQMH